jgi:hypothetical protein
MSDISHPPIRQDIGPGISIERMFAEEAYMMLAQCGVPLVEQIEPVLVTSLVTERVDMVANDDETSAALRLRSLPVLSIMASNHHHQDPSGDYTAIVLEYGESDDDDTAETFEESFNWRGYVLVVIAMDNLNDVSILDAQTGYDLDRTDIESAQLFLDQMRQENRNFLFENHVSTQSVITSYQDPTAPLQYTQQMDPDVIALRAMRPYIDN